MFPTQEPTKIITTKVGYATLLNDERLSHFGEFGILGIVGAGNIASEVLTLSRKVPEWEH